MLTTANLAAGEVSGEEVYSIALLRKANLLVQLSWLVELGSKLTSIHGGAVARLNVDRPSSAEMRRGEGLGSSTALGQCLSA